MLEEKFMIHKVLTQITSRNPLSPLSQWAVYLNAEF